MKTKFLICILLLIGFMSQAQTETKDDYKKATCKVFDTDGRLRNICEDQTVYKISMDNSKGTGKPIQNKNEICKSSKCIKVKVDASGFITLYNLPNTTQGITVGKIEKENLFSCKSKTDKLSLKATFKGDKNQAALIVAMEQFYR